jgi:hypothetical protein
MEKFLIDLLKNSESPAPNTETTTAAEVPKKKETERNENDS